MSLTRRPRFTRGDALLLAIGLASALVLWPARKVVAAFEINSFLGFAALQGCLCFVAARLIWNRGFSRASFWIVVGVSALLRLGLLDQTPNLSDDIYRYIWDGNVQAAGINPYRFIPADPHLAFLRDDDIYPKINRRDYAPTIYPPLAQLFFLAVTRVNGSVLWFKTVLFGLEMVTIALLGWLLAAMGLPRERAAIYGWNPLVIWEFGSGHIDVLMTTLVVLILAMRWPKRSVLTGIMLGAAILVKFFPIVLWPALYRRRDWKMSAAALATIFAGYLPYLTVGPRVFGFLSGYSNEEGLIDGRFFFPLLIHHLSAGWVEVSSPVYFFCGAILSLFLARLALLSWNNVENGFLLSATWLGAAFLLFLSPQYPWYWMWLTPLLAFVSSRLLLPLFYLNTAALLQYGKWFDDWPWLGRAINPYLGHDLLQFVPPAALLAGYYLVSRGRRRRERRQFSALAVPDAYGSVSRNR